MRKENKGKKEKKNVRVKKERPFITLFKEKRVMTITGSWVFYFIMSYIIILQYVFDDY